MNAAFSEGLTRFISISRPNPTFSLSPSAISFVCGTPQTRTFTVVTPNTISCSLTYNWELGPNKGWLLNGNPAPATFSTTANTVTLTSANGNVLPSNV